MEIEIIEQTLAPHALQLPPTFSPFTPMDAIPFQIMLVEGDFLIAPFSNKQSFLAGTRPQ